MEFNTYPSNPFPPSTDWMDELETEVSQLKNGLTNLIKFDSVTGPTSTSGVLSSSISDSRKILMAWSEFYMVNPYTANGNWKFVIGDASSVNGYVLVKETNVTVNYAYLNA